MKIFSRILFFGIIVLLGTLAGAYFVSGQNSSVTVTALVPGVCGNNILEPGEGCDDGNNISGDGCSADCKIEGAGGGVLPPPTQAEVIFSGKAYPNSLVTLLKDAQVAATTIAGTDANFYITLTSLSAGTYIFAIYSEDEEGRRSSLFIIPLSVPPGATTSVSNIFIAPTITTDKSEAEKGEEILISGQSAPMAEIKIFLKSGKKEFSFTAFANEKGKYTYNLDTSSLDFREYQLSAKAFLGNLSSNLSRIINFIVGRETISREPFFECALLKGDFNNDCLVNLIDFSILIYWFDRPNPPAEIDLDRNGKVNLIDFSIMAYYWTG